MTCSLLQVFTLLCFIALHVESFFPPQNDKWSPATQIALNNLHTPLCHCPLPEFYACASAAWRSRLLAHPHCLVRARCLARTCVCAHTYAACCTPIRLSHALVPSQRAIAMSRPTGPTHARCAHQRLYGCAMCRHTFVGGMEL